MTDMPMETATPPAGARACDLSVQRVLCDGHACVDGAESIRLEGGWVFAMGQGALSDPGSGLHRRDRFGIRQAGRYFSVDTGKYSTAPALAREVADRIGARRRA